MTSFSDVLDLAQIATEALNALEDTSRSRVDSIFGKYENGFMSLDELRAELLKQARAGFVTAGSVANEHVKQLAADAGIRDVDVSVLRDTPVLHRILLDIQRNTQTYADSEREDKDFRRLKFRVWLSVQTALRRGFTENQIAFGNALRAKGAALKKVWLANFVNNTPCLTCRALHGSEVSLNAEFDHGGEHSPKTFLGLQGPPRHPNCHCYMLVFVVTLESAVVVPEAPVVGEEQFMSAKDVRRLPRAVYTAVVTTMRLIAGRLKGALRGKR